MTVTFRCMPELAGILPRPIPAVQGLPGWFKSLPQKAFSATDYKEVMTIKKCPPFIDAMIYGFLIPLVADLKVENGEFSWDRDVPAGGVTNFPQSPIDFHDGAQVAGTPFFDDDRFIVKFNNFWTIADAARLFAAVHASAQPHRSALHHHRRSGRHRYVLRQPDQFSGALA